MSNMSYCRFRNTENDLNDCLEAAEELYQGNIDDRAEFYQYSRDEYRALERMIQVARDFAEYGELLLDTVEDEKEDYTE